MRYGHGTNNCISAFKSILYYIILYYIILYYIILYYIILYYIIMNIVCLLHVTATLLVQKFFNIYFGLHLPEDGHKSAETCSIHTVFII